MAVLIGMSAEVKGQSHEIARDKVTIGRNSTNLIVIEHPTVSGRHCFISRQGRRYAVTDLGSTNGTRVNGRDVEQESPLNPKDLLQVGSVEFMFDAEDAEIVEPIPLGRSETRVEIAQGAATSAPISFGSISPFGARRRDNATLWYVLIVAVGLLALAGVGIVLYRLFTGS